MFLQIILRVPILFQKQRKNLSLRKEIKKLKKKIKKLEKTIRKMENISMNESKHESEGRKEERNQEKKFGTKIGDAILKILPNIFQFTIKMAMTTFFGSIAKQFGKAQMA